MPASTERQILSRLAKNAPSSEEWLAFLTKSLERIRFLWLQSNHFDGSYPEYIADWNLKVPIDIQLILLAKYGPCKKTILEFLNTKVPELPDKKYLNLVENDLELTVLRKLIFGTSKYEKLSKLGLSQSQFKDFVDGQRERYKADFGTYPDDLIDNKSSIPKDIQLALLGIYAGSKIDIENYLDRSSIEGYKNRDFLSSEEGLRILRYQITCHY